jgi:hypothetical protein
MRLLILYCSVCLCLSSAHATDSLSIKSPVPTTLPGRAMISVKSTPAGARVYCDTLSLGVAPFDSVEIPAGTHVFAFIHPEAKNWQYSSIVETISVHASERLSRTPSFPTICRITSNPYGATVQRGGAVVGQTPLLLSNAIDGELVAFSKPGYENITIPIHTSYGELHIDLHPMTGTASSGQRTFLTGTQPKSDFPILATTGASIVTGVVAAYCKIKADSYYNDYSLNGNPQALKEMKRLDTIAGISLVASQASFLALCYLLMSR